MSRGKSSTEVKGGGFDDEYKWEGEIKWFKFPEGKSIIGRLIGSLYVMARHWIPTKTGKKKFPQWCTCFDSDPEIFRIGDWECPAHSDFGEDMRAQKMIIGHIIVRRFQKRRMKKFIRPFMIPAFCTDQMDAVSDITNAPLEHPKKGVDLLIKYNPRVQGFQKWIVQMGGQGAAPFTKNERIAFKKQAYDFETLIPDFSDEEVRAVYARQMKQSMANNKYYVKRTKKIRRGMNPWEAFEGNIDGKPFTAFPVLVRAKEGVMPTKEDEKAAPEVDYEAEDEDLEEMDFSDSGEGEEEEYEEGDDEEEDDLDEDEDEDEGEEEDGDEDEGEDEDEDEDADEDEDDEDDDFDADEDEDDDFDADDDDFDAEDEDEDDDFDDDEEEDEPPSRKKKKKKTTRKKTAAARSRKPVKKKTKKTKKTRPARKPAHKKTKTRAAKKTKKKKKTSKKRRRKSG